ncbi:MAG: sigma-70 family RNA polymerase sigma factor [Oscillospiraceae bacterium]|nr:sigma-70 family RNA polymerase sigma factor [Oscillospiraceae bacterium]
MRKKKDVPPLSPTQKQAVSDLYDAYKGLMAHTARCLTAAPEEVEEVMQDSLIALMRNIDTVSSLNRYKTAAYIVLTVRRTYFNRAGKERRLITVPLDDEAAELADALTDSVPLDADEKLDVMQLMDALSPGDRRILEAWYLEGCSAEQLAKELHCKPASVRAILSRVRKRAERLLREMEGNRRG